MEFFADRQERQAFPLKGGHIGGVVHPLFSHLPKDHARRTGPGAPEKLDLHLHRYGPGGFTRKNKHENLEQAYFILEGQMHAEVGGEERLAGPGTCVMIPRDTEHSFENAGEGDLVFLLVQVRPLE